MGCASKISVREDQQTSEAPTREAEPATSGGETSEAHMMSTLDRGEEGTCGDVDQSCCEQLYCDEERCEVLFSCSSDDYACRIFIRDSDHTSVCFDIRDCGDLGNHCCVDKVCSEGSCVRGMCEL